jgi:hypothetical protein
MPQPPVRLLPHRVFKAKPTYRDLSRELLPMAIRRYYAADTHGDKVTFAGQAARLLLAAQWEPGPPLCPWRYILKGVLCRQAPIWILILFVTNARYLLSIDPANSSYPPHPFFGMLLLGTILSVLSGILLWPLAVANLQWAERFRSARMKAQELLLSPQGLNGWRLVRDTDGRYVHEWIGTSDATPGDASQT